MMLYLSFILFMLNALKTYLVSFNLSLLNEVKSLSDTPIDAYLRRCTDVSGPSQVKEYLLPSVGNLTAADSNSNFLARTTVTGTYLPLDWWP